MGPVEKNGDAGFSRLEMILYIFVDLGTLGYIGMVQAFPGDVAGRFVAVFGAQICVTEEEE